MVLGKRIMERKMRKITVSDYTLKELCGKNGSQLLFREKLSVSMAIARYGADVIELPPVRKAKEDAVVYKTISESVKGVRIALPVGRWRLPLSAYALQSTLCFRFPFLFLQYRWNTCIA